MQVRELETPTYEELAQILELFKKIPGRTCTAGSFMDWIITTWDDLFIVIIVDNKEVKGFTIAQAPSILEPSIGWLPFSFVVQRVKQKFVQEGLSLAAEWLMGKGAKLMRFTSVRKPNALKRVYGMVPSKEVLYEKSI